MRKVNDFVIVYAGTECLTLQSINIGNMATGTVQMSKIAELARRIKSSENSSALIEGITRRFRDGGPVGEELLDKYSGTVHDPMAFWERMASSEPSARQYYIKNNIRESEEAKRVADYFRSYAGSDGARRILANQQEWWKERHPYRKLLPFERKDAFKPAEYFLSVLPGISADGVFDMDDYAAQSSLLRRPGYGMIKIGTLNALGTYHDEATAHEMMHTFNTPTVMGYPLGSGIGGAQTEALLQNTGPFDNGHDARLHERHSDLEAMRYLLFKEGIYDSRENEDATPEVIHRLREKYPDLRPLQQMTDEEAAWQINHVADNSGLQDSANISSSGGSIHIDPSKKGTFTAQATRMDMGVQEAARHIHAHPDNYSPVMRRKAAFALAASKWNKKEDGGILNRLHDFTGGNRSSGGLIERYGIEAVKEALGKMSGAKSFDNGGTTESYDGGVLSGASVSAYLPDISTKHGKQIAKNIAERILDGDLDISAVPLKYRNYVEGEINGAFPVTDALNIRRRSIAEVNSPLEERQRRAEMMARYSGGIKGGGIELTFMPSRPGRVIRTWLRDPLLDRRVYNGKRTPKQDMERSLNPKNYTGVGDYGIYTNTDIPSPGEAFKVNDFTEHYDNDFVSSLFNGQIPVEGSGIEAIPKSTLPLYQKVFGSNYPNIVGSADHFRGYQIRPDYLEEASKLDSLANVQDVTAELINGYKDYRSMNNWLLGRGNHFYDAGAYQKIGLDMDGKHYVKYADVFDVGEPGDDKRDAPLERKIRNFIHKNSRPYIVSTPWMEAKE